MIEKKDLEVGEWYVGRCRNASVACWFGDCFIHLRTKFGDTFAEEINHPEDDNGYDCFIPIRKLDTDISDEEIDQINIAEEKYL